MNEDKKQCKICKNDSEFIFKSKILNKYSAKYYKCSSCGFLWIEDPHWLDEAYSDAISTLDVGLVDRNIKLCNDFEKIIDKNFNYKGKFLDYAGGFGLFVRLMRDKGLNFWWYDKYCKNIFSQDFIYKKINGNFECITAIEVLEHLEEPISLLKDLLQYSDSILFTTVLMPDTPINSTDDWWYFTTLSGQHISFYTKESFNRLAKLLSCNYYTDGNNIHLLTKKSFDHNPVKKQKLSLTEKTLRKINKRKVIKKTSLIDSDYKLAKNKILSNNQENC